jgi:hypothetical protein
MGTPRSSRWRRRSWPKPRVSPTEAVSSHPLPGGSTDASAVALLLLGDLLGSLLLLLGHRSGSFQTSTRNKAHIRSQGRSHDGIERRHHRAENRDYSWFPHDDVHVVKDAPENCQEKFPNFFRFFPLSSRRAASQPHLLTRSRARVGLVSSTFPSPRPSLPETRCRTPPACGLQAA